MKFGIFYEHQLPRPWTENSEYELFQNSLDQIELADRLGYDYAWEVEHHFLEELLAQLRARGRLGAAISARTTSGSGTAIIQLTTNHPARVAERVSTLDLVSKGSRRVGMGESATTTSCTRSTFASATSAKVWEDAGARVPTDVL